MNAWDLLLIRKSLLRDLAEWVSDDRYGTLSAWDIRSYQADIELGKMLAHSSNPKITLRQHCASELLMWLGFYSVYDVSLHHGDFKTEAQRDEAKESQATAERNLRDLIRRYAMFLPESDAEPLVALIPEITQMPVGVSRDWGKHSTLAMDALKHAVAEWWENHDPEKPPKSDIVVPWLIQEHGLSKRLAEAIDSIIRSPEAKKGGNKRV